MKAAKRAELRRADDVDVEQDVIDGDAAAAGGAGSSVTLHLLLLAISAAGSGDSSAGIADTSPGACSLELLLERPIVTVVDVDAYAATASAAPMSSIGADDATSAAYASTGEPKMLETTSCLRKHK